MSNVIPADHPMWLILSDKLVNDLLLELPASNTSPALKDLYSILAQHPSNAAFPWIQSPTLTLSRPALPIPAPSNESSVTPSPSRASSVLSRATTPPASPTPPPTRCKRNGKSVALKAIRRDKRKNLEDTGEAAESGPSSKKIRVWRSDGVQPGPTTTASALLATMSGVSSSDGLLKIARLVQALLAGRSDLDTHLGDDYSLEATLKLCDIQTQDRALKSFLSMIGYIRLAFHLQRMKEQEKGRHGDLRHRGITAKQVYEWYNKGTRLIMLVAGGTAYILLIIASLELYQKAVDRRSEDDRDIISLAENLRQSSDPGFASLAEDNVIPMITKLHQFRPLADALTFRIFPSAESHSFIFSFRDLQEVDSRFQAFRTNVFYLPERSRSWDALFNLSIQSLSSLPTVSPRDLPLSTVAEGIAVFSVPYPKLSDARVITLPLTLKEQRHPKLNKANTLSWTEKQRAIVYEVVTEESRRAKSLKGLKRLLSSSFKRGAHLEDKFVYVTHKLLMSNALKFQDETGICGAFISAEASDYIRERIRPFIDILRTIFGDEEFADTDSSTMEDGFFNARLDIFNRFAEKGHGSPASIHPHFLYQSGASKVNHGQRTPYLCKTALDSPKEYNALMDALRDICQVINDLLAFHLPDQHSELSIFCEILPLNVKPATYPFPGCVVNIQVASVAHLDSSDKTICVVIPFGEFCRGELVLYEMGLVVEMKEGTVIAFRSFDVTHFNLHFQGFRGSLVLHADREADSWVENRNGWESHMAV